MIGAARVSTSPVVPDHRVVAAALVGFSASNRVGGLKSWVGYAVLRVSTRIVAGLLPAIVFGSALPLFSACRLATASNPTPGAKPTDIGQVWVRHLEDKHGREATAQVGFTLEDSRRQAIAADGEIAVELKWQQGMMEYIARGKSPVPASGFRPAKGKPVRDGTLYSEPWSIYLIGAQYPGPSQHGYDVTLTFTSKDGHTLSWRRWASPTR